MTPDPERIREALRSVEDPDLGTDVLAAGVVETVDVEDGAVEIVADHTGMAPPDREDLTEAMRAATFEVRGVESVTVTSVDGASVPEETVDGGSIPEEAVDEESVTGKTVDEESVTGESGPQETGADPAGAGCSHHVGGRSGAGGDPSGTDPRGGAPGVEGIERLPDRVVAVASAKGGVGKSTVTAELARGLADRGHRVGVFDADVYGPNLPSLLDVSGPVEADDRGRAIPVEAGSLRAMSVGFLANGAPVAWRGAMAHEAVLDLLTDTDWGECDTLVVDLPPGTGDVVLSVLQEVPVDDAVLVTTPYPTAVADTARSADLFAEEDVPVRGAVVNMAGFTCPDCDSTHDLFADADVEGALSVPVLGEVPFDPAVRRQGHEGATEQFDPVVEALESGYEDVPVPESALDLRGVPPRARCEQVCVEFDALEPGETLHVLTDEDPHALVSVLADRTEAGDDEGPRPSGSRPEAGDLEIQTSRRGPREWLLSVEAPARARTTN